MSSGGRRGTDAMTALTVINWYTQDIKRSSRGSAQNLQSWFFVFCWQTMVFIGSVVCNPTK
jgi:hypothetical protein